MKQKAAALRHFPLMKGHCAERGVREVNLLSPLTARESRRDSTSLLLLQNAERASACVLDQTVHAKDSFSVSSTCRYLRRCTLTSHHPPFAPRSPTVATTDLSRRHVRTSPPLPSSEFKKTFLYVIPFVDMCSHVPSPPLIPKTEFVSRLNMLLRQETAVLILVIQEFNC